jgi:phosphatidylinositol glycan class C protein
MKPDGGNWEKVLWKNQGFEDNYIDPQFFLESLRKNRKSTHVSPHYLGERLSYALANFKPYTYSSLVLLTCAITQQISSIFMFLGIFLRLRAGNLNPRGLLWFSMGAFCAGYVCWSLLRSRRSSRFRGRKVTSEQRKVLTPCKLISCRHFSTDLKTLKSSILVFLALMSLSPVLRTLTAATSSDSIWALSAVLFTLNALLADYSVMPTSERGRER